MRESHFVFVFVNLTLCICVHQYLPCNVKSGESQGEMRESNFDKFFPMGFISERFKSHFNQCPPTSQTTAVRRRQKFRMHQK